jgi:two-component system, response regulator YesN
MGKPTPALFYRFLVSYIITLLIPVLVLVYLVYGRFISVIEAEAQASLNTMVTATMRAVDERLRDLRRVAFQISTHPQLTEFAMTSSPAATINGMTIMNDMRAGTEFFTDVILMYPGTDTLFAASGTYSGRTLFGDIIRVAGIAPEEILARFRTAVVPIVLPLSGTPARHFSDASLVAFSYPVPMGSRTPNSAIVFLVAESSFHSIMSAGMRYASGSAVILDSDGNRIAEIPPAQPEQSTTETVSPVMTPDVFTARVTSEESGWSFVAAVPIAVAFAQVRTTQHFTTYGLVVTAILGSLAIAATMRLNYTPLNRIRNLIDHGLHHYSSSRWNYAAMERAIDELVSKHELVDAEKAHHMAAIREHLLVRILKGQVSPDERALAALARAGWPMSSVFVVVVLSVEGDGPTTGTRDALHERIDSSFRPATAWSVSALQNDRVIVVLALDRASPEAQTIVRSGHLRMVESLGCPVTAGVGSVSDNLEGIPRSYLDARTALDYRIVVGTGRVIWFSEVSAHHDSPVPYPGSEIQVFERRLRQGDVSGVNDSVTQIARRISSEGATLHMAKCVASELLTAVIRTLLELGWTFERIAREYADVMAIADIGSIEELSNVLRTTTSRLSASLTKGRESGNSTLRDELIAYMEDHFGDSSFTIQSMAATFGLSASYVSRFLKDQLGVSARDYIQQLRMDRARELLRSSDLMISEIVERVGYWDATGLIRRFKALEGMTPGEYRSRFGRSNSASQPPAPDQGSPH